MQDSGSGGNEWKPGESGPASGGEPLVERPRSDLHTGAEQPVDPIDLVMARGEEPTPQNIEKERRRLEKEGRVAVERRMP